MPRQGVARLLPNGDLDPDFVPSGFTFSLFVRGVVLQENGKVVIGGRFRINSDPSPYITYYVLLRLNANGSLDDTFNLVTTTEADFFRARLVRPTPEGKILAVSRCVARFNSDGTLDNSFRRLLFFDNFLQIDTECFWFEPLSNGKIIVPPTSPLQVGTNQVSGAFRLNPDGTLDGTFAPPAFHSEIYPNSSALQSDGKVMVWGAFEKVDNVLRPGVARFNQNGTLDESYPGAVYPNLITVPAAGLMSDNRLYALLGLGGPDRFVISNSLVRLLSNGQLDSTFTPQFEFAGQEAMPAGLFVQNDQPIVWRTDAQVVLDNNGTLVSRKLNLDGSVDRSFVGPTNRIAGLYRNSFGDLSTIVIGDFKILASLSNGQLIAAITADNYSQNQAGYDYKIIRLDADGRLDASFNSPILAGPVPRESFPGLRDPVPGFFLQVRTLSPPTGPLNAAEELPGGSILVAGGFTQVGGQACAGLAKLLPNGLLDPAFPAGSGATIDDNPLRCARVDSLARDGQGRIWVTGNFDRFNGAAANGVIRLNTNGTLDTSFVSQCAYYGLNDFERTKASDAVVANDGSVYVVGPYRLATESWPHALTRLVDYGPPTLTSQGYFERLGFWLTANLVAGQTARLQASTNLQNWDDLDVLVGGAAPITVGDPAAKLWPRRFYRLMTP